MAVTPPSFTKSKAVCGEVVPKENRMNLELRDTENPGPSIFWEHTSYQLIARDSPMVLSTSLGTMFSVGFLLQEICLTERQNDLGLKKFLERLHERHHIAERKVASLHPNPSPTSIWFRTNVLNWRFSQASVCKNAHELLTEAWKNSVIPSEDIADPAVENPEGTL